MLLVLSLFWKSMVLAISIYYKDKCNHMTHTPIKIATINQKGTWGTGIGGLMIGMATLPKVTRSY